MCRSLPVAASRISTAGGGWPASCAARSRRARQAKHGAIGLLAVSLALLAVSVTQMLNRPEETLQAMNEVFAY